MLVPALTLPVRGATLFVATMPVPASPSGGQHCGQQLGQLTPEAVTGDQSAAGLAHFGIIAAGGAVDGEHAAGITHAQHLLPGEPPMDIARQRCEKGQLAQMRLPIEKRLIEMRDAPPLGNVEAERLGQLRRRRAGHRIAPCAEGHQQLAGPVKGQIAVHHCRDPDAAHCCKGLPVFCLHIGGQRGVGVLQAGMHGLQRVGPDAVLQPVFPSEVPLRHRGMATVHQHRLDAGRAEFNTECALSEVEHGITPCQILSVLYAGILPPVSCFYYTRQRSRRPVPAVLKGGFLFKKNRGQSCGDL